MLHLEHDNNSDSSTAPIIGAVLLFRFLAAIVYSEILHGVFMGLSIISLILIIIINTPKAWKTLISGLSKSRGYFKRKN